MMHLPMGLEQSYPTSTHPDGSDRPIAYASCTLSISEQNYAQIEKRGWLSYMGSRNFTSMFMVGNLL